MTEKILIIVKTYPTLSRKYAELVYTAGVTENGIPALEETESCDQ